jgi:hypothetical protein
MKKIFFVGLILISEIVFGQQFNFKQIDAAAIESLHKTDKSKPYTYPFSVTVSDDYFPNANKYNLGAPIVRTMSLPGFRYETSYYISLPDSTVRLIEYWWEGTSANETEFNKQVEANKKTINKYFGEAGKEIPAHDVKAAKTVWENETTHVEQFIIPFYRIRVLVSWK